MKIATKKKASKNGISMPQPVNARAWQLAQIVAALADKTTVEIRQDGQETVSTHNRKVQLEWLLQDAEYLLLAAERKTSIVHAYTLFADDYKFMGIETAKKTFAAVGWRGLSSWPSCETLLETIIKALHEHEKFSKEGSIFTHVSLPENTTKTAFWVSPDDLVRRGDGNKGPKQYRVRTILLLAHLFCREQFSQQIEISVNSLQRKNTQSP